MLSPTAAAWEISDMTAISELRGRALYDALMDIKPEGLAETEWAARAGINRGFFTNLKSSEISPRGVTLEKLLAAVGAADRVPSIVRAAPGAGKTKSYTEVISRAAENVVTLRSFDLSYSMGPGTNIDDYVEDEEVQFDAGMLAKLTRAPAESLFVARGEGDSMFPTLLNDDTIVIDTTQKVVNLRDRIWACSIHGAGAIKRLRPSAEGKVEVISDNPAIKDDLVDAVDIHIIGRVIWLGRRV
ncbi:putative transcriptional regulator [Novosphingobium sp. AP12]|nr:putative transcriptional regulator [Novosphingobium sp. AP12]